MLSSFYAAFATVSFTVLGIWMFVVQARRLEWVGSREHLRRAYAIHLQFGLAGLMSLLSLVDPNSKALWRVSFGAASALGAVVLILLHLPHGEGLDRLAVAGNVLATILFVVIGVIAAFPSLPDDIGLGLRALEVEAIALSTLVFLGVNMAWLLMFDEVPSNDPAS